MHPIKTDLSRYDSLACGYSGQAPTTELFPDLKTIDPGFWKSSEAKFWEKFQADWFFIGLASHKLIPREGVDTKAALQHLNVIQRSWDIPHEDKIQAVVWLLHEWFSGGTWIAGKTPVSIETKPRKRVKQEQEITTGTSVRAKNRQRNGYSCR